MNKINLFLVVFFMCTISAYSQHSGTLTQSNVRIGDCIYSSVTVKYKVGHFMGEPTVNGAFKCTGSSDCKLPYSATVWLKIQHPNGGSGYIKLDPTVPKVNEGYGFNVTGSPNWDAFICGFDGTRKTACFDKEKAKTLYKEGRIVSFTVTW